MYNAKKQELSAKSIRSLHGVLYKALAQAMKIRYIRYNPADECELPRVIDKPIKPIEGENVNKFLTAIKGHKYETLYKVTLFTGVRQGEVLGLTWDDIDFADSTISINKQIQKERIDGGGGKYRFVPLKDDKGRIIAPATYVLDALHDHNMK